MYTPNHAMIPITPPHGTQIVGTVDGTHMFIFDRSIRERVCTFLEGLLEQARAVTEKAASVGTTPAEVTQGKVIVGDVVFPMVPTAPPAVETDAPPESTDRVLTMVGGTLETNLITGEQILHTDIVSAYSIELTKLDETVHVDVDVAAHMEAANKRGQHTEIPELEVPTSRDTDLTPPPPPTEPQNNTPIFGDF